jgi:hypothetical protein
MLVQGLHGAATLEQLGQNGNVQATSAGDERDVCQDPPNHTVISGLVVIIVTAFQLSQTGSSSLTAS